MLGCELWLLPQSLSSKESWLAASMSQKVQSEQVANGITSACPTVEWLRSYAGTKSTRCFGAQDPPKGSALPGTRPRLCSFPLCFDILFALVSPASQGFHGTTANHRSTGLMSLIESLVEMDGLLRNGFRASSVVHCTILVSSNISLSATGSADNLPVLWPVEQEAFLPGLSRFLWCCCWQFVCETGSRIRRAKMICYTRHHEPLSPSVH